MRAKKRVPMRLRRIISLSVLSALVLSAISIFGMPVEPAEEIAGIPIEEPVAEAETKPVTIFDPPKYSLEKADSLWVVVNKHRPLSPIDYRPDSLRAPAFENPALQNPLNLQLREDASLAAEQLAIAMNQAGKGILVLNSGFRPFERQQELFVRSVALRGQAAAEKITARAGFSEHQIGLAADFSAAGQGCSIMVCFGETEAGSWLSENAHNYGFILRYPKEASELTGFQYEPWHFRYVGVELAIEMKEKNIQTLEQFWSLPSAPSYLEPAG
jgi:D-alanyl-D-alanine carboxypeptidase